MLRGLHDLLLLVQLRLHFNHHATGLIGLSQKMGNPVPYWINRNPIEKNALMTLLQYG